MVLLPGCKKQEKKKKTYLNITREKKKNTSFTLIDWNHSCTCIRLHTNEEVYNVVYLRVQYLRCCGIGRRVKSKFGCELYSPHSIVIKCIKKIGHINETLLKNCLRALKKSKH